MKSTVYSFGGFRLEAENLLLLRNSEVVPLAPKACEVLLTLIESNGKLVTKQEILDKVWANTFVEEANLSHHISALRKALGEDKNGRRFIETIPRRGYRFVAPLIKTNNGAAEIVVSETPNGQAEDRTQIIKPEFIEESARLTPNNLTENPLPIIGREKEIAEIAGLLRQTDTRLVTMSGVGGTGKTKLAQAVAGELLNEFSDGVFFIELAAITNEKLVASTIAQSLGVKESGGCAILEILKDYLRGKKMLLVIDNFEQITDAAPIIAELLSAGKLKILITSRTLLRLSFEKEFVVTPLAVPTDVSQDSPDELLKYEAIKLFIEKAGNAKPNFALTKENAGSVAEICARLDGLPLAIELAAARLRILSPQMILTKLENRLKLLTGGARDLPVRQQTMRGAVEWSYDLLNEEEKRLFRRLSVFAGGSTFEAAEAVCATYDSDEEEDDLEVLDLITSLVDKSLLLSKEKADGEMRFRMLETVREYALESLERNNEAEAVRHRHASYFLAFGEETQSHLEGERAVEWLNLLEEEQDNLRAALLWSLKNDSETSARLAAALRFFWIFHAHLTEGRKWLSRALEKTGISSASVRTKLLNGIGVIARNQADYETARTMHTEVLAISQTEKDEREILLSLRGLGALEARQGHFKEARNFCERALTASRELNNKIETAYSLAFLGNLNRAEEDNAGAYALFLESLAIFKQLDNKEAVSVSLYNLGATDYDEGNYEKARSYFEEGLVIAQKLRDKINISYFLDGFAALALQRGELYITAQLAGAAEHLRESIDYEMDSVDRRFRIAYIAKLKAKTDETAFAAAYEQGMKLKLEEAVALCFKDKDTEITR